MNDYDRRMLAALESIAESAVKAAEILEKMAKPVKIQTPSHNPFDSTASNQIPVQTIADDIPKLIEPMGNDDL